MLFATDLGLGRRRWWRGVLLQLGLLCSFCRRFWTCPGGGGGGAHSGYNLRPDPEAVTEGRTSGQCLLRLSPTTSGPARLWTGASLPFLQPTSPTSGLARGVEKGHFAASTEDFVFHTAYP